jgi:putative SOS response-associated peptidase YedK
VCNLYTQSKSIDEVARLFRELDLPLTFPEGLPNLQSRDVCITDPAPIVRAAADDPARNELVIRRWSWPGAGGKPVYNFRSEGREFSSGRCLILADGFYEFTRPRDASQKRKDRWLFTSPAQPMLGIAGLIRNAPPTGEAFTMLTTEPGPDVAPYHGRQVALLAMDRWRSWLDYSASAQQLLGPVPAGTLQVETAPRGEKMSG